MNLRLLRLKRSFSFYQLSIQKEMIRTSRSQARKLTLVENLLLSLSVFFSRSRSQQNVTDVILSNEKTLLCLVESFSIFVWWKQIYCLDWHSPFYLLKYPPIIIHNQTSYKRMSCQTKHAPAPTFFLLYSFTTAQGSCFLDEGLVEIRGFRNLRAR